MPTSPFLVSGRYLFPTHRNSDVLTDHGLIVTGNSISEIGPTQDLIAKYPDIRHIATPHGLIMPGLINTHTHAPMSCFRGIADDLPLMEWLTRHIFPVEAKLTAEMVYSSTLLSIIEMIKSGTTSFCDMYLFSKEVARAADEAGIRAWIGEVLYDFPSPNYGSLENGFVYLEDLLATYRHHPRITITVDPHSVYTCSPDLLSRLGKIATRENCLYHIHLSENKAEVATCQERYGCTPVEHLERLGLLSERTLAAHCVQLSPSDIELLARRRVKISHCLESNMKLASGIAPVVELQKAGVCVAMGTDGSASNNDVDMFGEMSSVAKVHKATLLDPTVLAAEEVVKMATLNGARALLADESIGTLEVGKRADLIVLNMDQPHLIPLYSIPSHLVYAVRGSDVLHSIIDGKLIMQNKKLQTLDESAILSRMREMSLEIRRFTSQTSIT